MKAIKNNERGFTLIELLVAFALVGVVLVVGSMLIQDSKDKSRVDQIVGDVSSLKTAAERWRNNRNSFTGLTCATLVPTYVKTVSACTAGNPFGGNYVVAPANSCGGAATDLCIQTTGVPTKDADQLVNTLTGMTKVAPTNAAGTVTAIFEG